MVATEIHHVFNSMCVVAVVAFVTKTAGCRKDIDVSHPKHLMVVRMKSCYMIAKNPY